MRNVLLALPAAVVLLAGCGGSTGHRTAAATVTRTRMVTDTTTTLTTPPGSAVGYLNPKSLASGIVNSYNATPPLWARATAGTCVVSQANDTAVCTLATNRGPVVEPVSIASDGSNYQYGPGMGG